MKRVAFVALALSCGAGGGRGAAGGGDYQVGTLFLHVASGAAVNSSGLNLYLSDQPDTCQSLSFVPVQRATRLALRVAPAADGTTRATVVTKPTPGPGEAKGSLSQSTGGVAGDHYDASDGAVAWTVNPGGSVTITILDIGFSGTPDRILTTSALTVPPCSP